MPPVVPKKTPRSDIPARPLMPSSPAPHPQEEARRLVVGPGIHLQGNVSSCAHLIVEGRIDAALLTAQRLDVLLGGQFSGTAEVHEAVISGQVRGELTVTGRLLLRPGARVSGDVRYGSLQIEPGAQLNGTLAPIGALPDDRMGEAPVPAKPPHLSVAAPAGTSNNVEILFADAPRSAALREEGEDDDVIARREAPGGYRRYR